MNPPRVNLARLPTPLEPLRKLSAQLGGPMIWVKRDDLTEGPGSGNKLRKLEYSIGQALADKANVVITAGAVQSNHCRATAFAAARLGLKCHLLLAGKKPDSAFDGNLFLEELMGAKITFIRGREFAQVDQLYEQISDDYRQKGDVPFVIPVGASDEIGLWGYINCVQELKVDFDRLGIHPSHIISASGSGSTLGGLALGAQLHDLPVAMEGICVTDDAASVEASIANFIQRWSTRYQHPVAGNQLAGSLRVIDGYVGPGYGSADEHVFSSIRKLAQLEGLILEPVYTGKAFDAMLQRISAGVYAKSADIVFVHTGGLYGLFPHRHAFYSH